MSVDFFLHLMKTNTEWSRTFFKLNHKKIQAPLNSSKLCPITGLYLMKNLKITKIMNHKRFIICTWRPGQGFPNSVKGWGESWQILLGGIFLKYWTSIKIKFSMTCQVMNPLILGSGLDNFEVVYILGAELFRIFMGGGGYPLG